MERVISNEERIRRAEEIYARRKKVNGIRVQADTVNRKKDYSLFKKMILQIVICLVIYLIFYLIKNSNYIFSESVINTSKQFLSYDLPFDKYYEQACAYYNDNIKVFITNKEENNVNSVNNDESVVSDSENKENIVNQDNNQDIRNEIKSENAVDTGNNEAVLSESEETSADEDNVELSQMEIDARDILSNYDMIVPLKGIVSSRFGPRTPTSIVSANHAGIDIAANEGTVFVAAMDGVVTFVSSERWLWKSYIY